MIRIFAPLDETPRGLLALAYVDLMVELGLDPLLASTRTFGMQGVLPTTWGRHQRRLLARAGFAATTNVVIGEITDWARLWTKGMRNVLVTDALPPAPEAVVPGFLYMGQKTPDETAGYIVARFDAVVLSSPADLLRWKALHAGAGVIPPTPLSPEAPRDAHPLRAVLQP